MAGPFFQDAGKAVVTNLTSGLGGVAFKWGAIGTGAGPANSAGTALTTEVETRGVGTISRVTTTVTNDTHQVVVTSTATATRAITEVGLFDQLSAGGNMIIGSGITTVNLANGDSLQITYKLAFA